MLEHLQTLQALAVVLPVSSKSKPKMLNPMRETGVGGEMSTEAKAAAKASKKQRQKQKRSALQPIFH